MVAFHWLPGAFAAATPFVGFVCGAGPLASIGDGVGKPWGAHHGAEHDCKLCAGAGVSAPAIVPVAPPRSPVALLGDVPRSFDLSPEAWAPTRARPPPLD